MPPKLVVAMGFQEDGWSSSRFWTEQLYDSLLAAGHAADLFAPSLGRRPRWWDRRFAYPSLLPKGHIVQLMDQSYGNALHALGGSSRSVALIHDIDFWRSRTWWNAWVRRRILSGLARADRRVAVSRKTAEEVRRELGLEVHAVIAPGFDLEAFSHSPSKREERTLLHVGTLVARKGPDRLIRLLAAMPGWRLHQIGGVWGEGERKLMRDLKVEERITSRGKTGLADLAEAYRRASAFVMPSRYEGFGMPAMEARLVGTPAFVSKEVPAAEHFEGDVGGHVVDFSAFDEGGRERARVEVVCRIVEGATGPVAFPRRERFSWERAAKEFSALYASLG